MCVIRTVTAVAARKYCRNPLEWAKIKTNELSKYMTLLLFGGCLFAVYIEHWLDIRAIPVILKSPAVKIV